MSQANHSLVFNEVPTGYPIPGQTVKLVASTLDLDTPLNGGILVKSKALSIDPYMRGRMRHPEAKSYSPPFDLNAPLGTLAVGEVLKSDNPRFKAGDHLYGFLKMEEFQVVSKEGTAVLKVLENKEKLPWSTWVGAAGMPGQTAHYGFYTIGKPVKGETIFVSAASGAVGLIVAQLAKREGLFVIGSAGSDEKVDFLKSVGCFDIAFNYKTENTLKVLQGNPPDIYFDNVGGSTLDDVLVTMNTFGRIIACGCISDYNLPFEQKFAHRNLFNIVGKQLTFQGFIISGKDATEFYATVPAWIADGTLKIKEHVTKGLDNGEAFLDLLQGRNFGKAVYVLE